MYKRQALAEADSKATGPGVWGEWKASLILDLVRRSMRLIDGGELPVSEPLTAEQIALAESAEYAVRMTPAEGHMIDVTMVAPDQPGLLSKMAGVLALGGLRSHSVNARSHGAKAVNTFVVIPVFGSPPEAGLVRQQLIAAVEGKIDVLARLDARERDSPIPTIATVATTPGAAEPVVEAGHPRNAVPALFAVAPPRALWIDGPSGEALLELRTDDRIGLLSRVSAVLERHGADIRWARVATLGSTVVDTFGLRLSDETESARAALADAVLAVCPPPQPRSDDEDGDSGPTSYGGTGRSGVPIS